jgi:hypothetical protein
MNYAGMDTYLIGSGAGFSGDRVDAPLPVVREMIASGRPGALIFETLAERTLALRHAGRRTDPSGGYEPLLAELVRPILRDCIAHGIPIVGNFGAANPPAAARLIRDLAAEAGIDGVRIAIVEGDDIRESIDLDELEVWESDVSLVGPADQIVAANVYIGARAIADALKAGAQVVVTGRVVDPALTVGPLMAHFGWAWDDWDRIAAATLVGHLLECGAQVTGGYFGDPGFKDVPSPESIGFPIAEVTADGTAVITKPRDTGGLVTCRTVKEQMIYEIHDPSSYLTPDVVLDITQVAVEQVGKDRVRVSGARGRQPPLRLKAIVSFPGDWLGEAEISYAGPNAMARARMAAETIGRRIDLRGIAVRRRLDLIGALSVFDSDAGVLQAGTDLDPPEVRVRLAVSASQRRPVEQCMQEVVALLNCGPAGGGGARFRMENRLRTASYLVPRDRVPTGFHFLEELVAA